MGLLDRFRAQPDWQHPDASVRAAAVHELPDEDQELLSSLAQQDPDAHVRRLAARRLHAVDRLAQIAQADGDDEVRAEARLGLLRIARESDEEQAALGATAALADTRDLTDVAKSASLEAASRAALDRIADPKALGSIARRSRHAGVRREALGRVEAPEELLSVAVKSDDREIAPAAFERVLKTRPDDRDTLAVLAVRARNRVVRRRARAVLRGLEGPAEARRTDALAREEREKLCADLEASLRATESSMLGAILEDAQRRWTDLAEDEDVPAPEEAMAERFAAACDAVRQRLAEREAERAAERRRDEEVARAVADRMALCGEVEHLVGEGALGRLEEIRRVWAALPPFGDDARIAAVVRRFAAACEGCGQRFSQWEASQARRAEFERLLSQAAAVVDLPDIGEARTRWNETERSWHELVRSGKADEAQESSFAAARDRLRTREQEARVARDREQQQNAARIATLCDRLESLARSDRLTLREADTGLREVRAALEEVGPLPRREQDHLVSRVRSVHGALTARVRELRELHEWQKWANLSVQEALCREIEALGDFNDLPQLARKLRELLDRWRKASPAPREQSNALWRRFKAAYDIAHARCEKFFIEQAAVQAGHLKLKEALCAQAEALADSTDWVKTAQHFERLQIEWKAVGPVPRDQAAAIWQRFRIACDRFYTRRKTDLARRKGEWAQNLQRKEGLCAHAEALAESTEWERTLAEIRRLQSEWRTIGPVKKNKSEAVWQRFRTACDRFFERYQQRDRLALAAKVGERDEILHGLIALLPEAGQMGVDPPADLLERVSSARARWEQAASLPAGEQGRQNQRLTDVLGRLVDAYPESFRGTDVDPDLNRRKMDKLCARIEGLAVGWTAADDAEGASPAEILARRWRDALAAKQLGVKVDEDAKWREAVEEVRRAQTAWRRLGPVPGEVGRALAERFHKACRRILDRRPKSRRMFPASAK